MMAETCSCSHAFESTTFPPVTLIRTTLLPFFLSHVDYPSTSQCMEILESFRLEKTFKTIESSR